VEGRARILKLKSYRVFFGIERRESEKTVIFGIRLGVLSGNTHTHIRANGWKEK
jgi:hypothetical protein